MTVMREWRNGELRVGEAVECQNSLKLITEEVSSDDPVLNRVSCVRLMYSGLFAHGYGSQDSDKTE